MFEPRGVRLRAVWVSLVAVVWLGFPMRGAGQAQDPFLGSVPTGQATGTTLDLTLKGAIQRALQYNLGGIVSREDTRAAHAVRLRRLSNLLPNLSANLQTSVNQIDLRGQGFRLSIPGAPTPTIVGPFAVEDVRGYLSEELFSWSNIKNLRSAAASELASRDTYKSDRDLVVFTTGNAYLVVNSDQATVESIRAQVKTAQTLYENDVDVHRQGVIANIDLLRAQVELQTQQQRLIAAENQLSIDKLGLARIIGLPAGQVYRLTDSVPYALLSPITLPQALQQAYASRPDYLSARADVRAAELAREGAAAENYPTLSTTANYGDIGSPNFGTSHGTFSVALALDVPIFQGTLVRADKLQADSALQQRRAELADLGGRIDQQVRTAFFNLKSSSDLVSVARSNINLANQTLSQALDRFRAGIADNLEVVQAQESVATAEQSYIASLYSFNLAKLSLSLAMGVAEQSAMQDLGMR